MICNISGEARQAIGSPRVFPIRHLPAVFFVVAIGSVILSAFGGYESWAWPLWGGFAFSCLALFLIARMSLRVFPNHVEWRLGLRAIKAEYSEIALAKLVLANTSSYGDTALSFAMGDGVSYEIALRCFQPGAGQALLGAMKRAGVSIEIPDKLSKPPLDGYWSARTPTLVLAGGEADPGVESHVMESRWRGYVGMMMPWFDDAVNDATDRAHMFPVSERFWVHGAWCCAFGVSMCFAAALTATLLDGRHAMVLWLGFAFMVICAPLMGVILGYNIRLEIRPEGVVFRQLGEINMVSFAEVAHAVLEVDLRGAGSTDLRNAQLWLALRSDRYVGINLASYPLRAFGILIGALEFRQISLFVSNGPIAEQILSRIRIEQFGSIGAAHESFNSYDRFATS